MSIVSLLQVIEPGPVQAMPAEGDDGRRLRAERNRDAVVDALLALYDEGHVQPGVARIAERAGVSSRSVFRHFADLDALAAATIERQWSRVRELFEPPPPGGDLATRVEALTAQRLRLHDTVAGVARAATLHVLMSSSPTVAAAVGDRRRLLAEQVTTLFAPELQAIAEPARREVVADALEAAASLENVEHLRTHVGLDRERAAAVVRHSLLAVLTAAPGAAGR